VCFVDQSLPDPDPHQGRVPRIRPVHGLLFAVSWTSLDSHEAELD
jgi:hypothetical protein